MTLQASPRFRRAIASGRKIHYFAEIWPRVLNDVVDSQADWQACAASSDMDFTTAPGYAILDKGAEATIITQTSYNSTQSLTGYILLESFLLEFPAQISSVVLNFAHTSDALIYVLIVDGNDTCYCMTTATVTASGEKTFTFSSPVSFAAGTYYIFIVRGSGNVSLRYQNTDVYANGAMFYIPVLSGQDPYPITGDAYFKINVIGYMPTGTFTTKTMNLIETPSENGTVLIVQSVPDGARSVLNLYGSDTLDFASTDDYLDVKDGTTITPRLFWKADGTLYSGSGNTSTPQIDAIDIQFPVGRRLYREMDAALPNISDGLRRSARATLKPISWTPSELKLIDRVSSMGEVSLTISDSQRDDIQNLISGSTLKNCRAYLYAGCDEPGFQESDLFRCFLGSIKTGSVKPSMSGDRYEVTFTIQNPLLAMKQKVPVSQTTGVVDFSTVAIDWDGVHVIDAMLKAIRENAWIPSRYLELDTFTTEKPLLGYNGVGSSLLVVDRSDAGAVDKRIKKPEDLAKILQALCVIADGYLPIGLDGRIAFVRHDENASADATWADRAMVRDGLNAIPIEAMGDIKLGYDDLLYNACYVGTGWDGNGDDWGKNFSQIYCHVDADSADDFAPGAATHIVLFEKLMVDASKYLGDEDTYHGETIAEALAQRIVDRFKYPPVRLSGVVVPVSQFLLGQGSVVQIHSREFVKYRSRGIGPAETRTFMVTLPQYDQRRNKMIFDLVELT